MDTISSDIAIKNLKLPTSGRKEFQDKRVPGLLLRLSPRGKTWLLYSRLPGTERPTRMKIGVYGEASDALTLKEARRKAEDWKEKIKGGDDPREELKEKLNRRKDTFSAVVDRFLNQHVNRNLKENTQVQYHSILNGSDVKHLSNKPIRKITRQHIIAVLDKIVESDRLIQANRTLAVLRKFFNWCAEKDIIKANEPTPTDRIKRPIAKEKPRSRCLSPEELSVVWRAAEKEGWPFGDHIRLLITTGQRQFEAATIRRQDITGDQWLQQDNKGGRQHIVPIKALSKSILEGVPAIPETRDYYFSTTGKGPISGFSKAKRRLDAEIARICQEEELELFKEPWQTHDLRRTVTTTLRKLGTPQEVCTSLLNHAPKGVTAQHYDVYDMLPEKERALEVWNNYLEQLLSGKPENVVEFRTGK